MAPQFELFYEPHGRWVAEVRALPGLQLYGSSEDETLEAAKTLCSMLGDEGSREHDGILAFYPGHIPDTAPPLGTGCASE